MKETKQKKVPLRCPSCESTLHIARMFCPDCGTEVSGDYEIPRLMRLTAGEQEFVEAFILSSGSLKEMSRHMNISYPTVRNLLDDIIEKLNQMERNDE